MRTKTLLLSALLGTVGSISAMSQSVYSINSVGYITITLYPGFNMIANQLIATGGNSLSNTMNNTSGAFDGLQVFEWNGSTFNTDIGDSLLGDPATGWDFAGQLTINPGQAAWMENPAAPGGANMTVTFVGTVPQGTNVVTLNLGFTQFSSPAPIGGDLVTAAGFTTYLDGDTVYAYNNDGGHTPTGFIIYQVDELLGTSGFNSQWDAPGDPILNVGQGAWYLARTAGTSFSQVFSVNQ